MLLSVRVLAVAPPYSTDAVPEFVPLASAKYAPIAASRRPSPLTSPRPETASPASSPAAAPMMRKPSADGNAVFESVTVAGVDLP